ncbi:MAG: CRISPR-associated ring nuclease [Paracoccaceae bacterium]
MTMGGQAQVVTFALDALLERGASIDTVLVLHLAVDRLRVRRALAQLTAEFAGDLYRGHPCAFRHIPIQRDGRPLSAIDDARAAEAAWALGRDLLAELKDAGQRLHICLAGGPRILALTLTSAAALYCDHDDRLWHLYTPRPFMVRARDGAILHAPADAGVRLLPVPLMPWGAYLPGLRDLMHPARGPQLSPQDVAACQAVWQRLTPRQREVVEVLADGALLQETADALGITLNTLNTHKTEILAECRIAWAMDEGAHLTYHFIREKFGPWLALPRSRPLSSFESSKV